MKRAVFLDRDGVIIRTDVRDGKPYAITAYEDLDILDGAPGAIDRLKEAGFVMIVVSNQPDVAAGKVARDVVEGVEREGRKLRLLLPRGIAAPVARSRVSELGAAGWF